MLTVYSVKLATLKREMFYSDQSTLEVFNYFLFTPGYADCTKNVKPKLIKKKLSQVFVVFIIGVK